MLKLKGRKTGRREEKMGWRCNLVVKRLPIIYKDIDSIPQYCRGGGNKQRKETVRAFEVWRTIPRASYMCEYSPKAEKK